MQEWTSDTLWTKAKKYSEKAFEVDPRSSLFPLLASFALELLGKSALSKVHPALIADPRGEGQNILFAFGVPSKDPKTIVASTVFKRLVQFVKRFTEEDASVCLLMAERRNRELHTGESSYHDYSTGSWLPDYYRISAILTEFWGKDLADFLGSAERAAEALETNLNEVQKVKSDVIQRISDCAKRISVLKVEELKQRRLKGEPQRSWSLVGSGVWIISRSCPACGSKGSLTIKHIADRPAEIVESSIFVEEVYSPRKFECAVCDLSLTGVAELRVANLADEIIDSTESDPVEYFDIETTPDREDYGNE